MKKREGTVVKVSSQSEHFSVLTLKGSVADPGCLSRIRVFSHPGSRISDPESQKTWGGKIFFLFYLFSYLFVAFHPCWNRSWLITVAHFIIFEKLPFWGVIFFPWKKNFTSKKAIFQIFGHKKRLLQKSDKTTQNKKNALSFQK